MNTLHEMLQSPLVQRLGWTLLHSLWQGVLAAAVLKIVLMATRDRAASARYLSACIVLLLTLGAFVYTFSILRIAQPQALAAAMTSTSAKPFDLQPPQSDRSDIPIDAAFARSSFAGRPIAVRPPPAPAVAAKPPQLSWRANVQQRAMAWFPIVLPWFVLIWAVGVVLMSLWNFGGWLAVQQLRYLNTHPAGSDSVTIFQNLSTRLGLSRTVRLMQSTLARTPLVIGVFRPMILVPAAVFTDLPVAELESILAHELAHVLRHDYLINLLQSTIETLLFYHPAIWWISRQIRIEREHCCDDLAILITRDRATYVRALAAVASVRAPALAPAAAAGKLLPRLRRILGAPPSQQRLSARELAGALMVLCFVGALVVHFRQVAKAADDAHAITPSKVSDDLITVRGQVFDPQGRPATGARISASPLSISGGNISFDTNQDLPRVLAVTHSGPDGRFVLTFKKTQASVFTWGPGNSGADLWKEARIVAAAHGFGLAWKTVDQLDERGELALNLVADEPIDGRIIDLEGRPVIGAPIMVTAASDYVAAEPAATADSKKPAVVHELLNDPLEMLEGASPIATDQDGRFHIAGLGKDRVVYLNSQSQRAAIVGAQVLTRGVVPPGSAGTGQPVLYGSHFEIAAPPALTIAGTVRDASTHLPVAGVRVEAGNDRRDARSITDAQGRYRLDGIPSHAGHSVILCFVCEDQPYLPLPYEQAPAAASNEPVQFDVELRKGIWITGKVTSKSNGAAVPALVSYWPFTSNQAARGLAPFNSFDSLDNPLYYFWRTQSDGSYRVVGLPGQGVVYARSGTGLYLQGIGFDQLPGITQEGLVPTLPLQINAHSNIGAIAQLNVPTDKISAQIDLQLDPGRSIRINCIDPQSAPISDLSVIGARSNGFTDVVSGSSFDSVGFSPDETRLIMIMSRRKALGKAIAIRAVDAAGGQLTLQLQPLATITGRLVNADGDPIKGGRVEPNPILANKTMRGWGRMTTSKSDEHGRFSLSLATGCDYRLDVYRGPAFNLLPVKQALSLHPGDRIDLGDIPVDGPKAGQTAAADKPEKAQTSPAPKPIAEADDVVHIRGSVLDPMGRPMADALIAVAPVWPDSAGQNLPQVIAKSRSGADGRFSMEFRKSAASVFVYQGGTSGRDLWKKTQVVASAPNFGLAWNQFDHVDANGELVLQLVDDLPIEGRVIDLEGQPVSGAKIRVSGVVNHILAKWTANDSDYRTPPLDYSRLDDPRGMTDDNAAIVSDVDGRFRVTGMGRERLVGLHSESSKVSFVGVNVLTRDMPPVTQTFFGPDQNKTAYFGNKFEIAAPPAISISGTVRDHATHLPLAGVRVKTRSSHGEASRVTDAQGHYRLDGLVKVPRVPINLDFTCDDRPYIPELLRQAPELAAGNSIAFDIQMHKGVWISGKVTDRRTHEPLPAFVDYWPSASNPAAMAMQEFRELAFSPAYCFTHPDGSYRLAVLPDRGVVTVTSGGEKYRNGVGAAALTDKRANGQPNTLNVFFRADLENAVREVNVSAEKPPAPLDFELDPNDAGQKAQADGAVSAPAENDRIVVRGIVFGPDGKPSNGARVVAAPGWPLSSERDRPAVLATTHSGNNGRFEIAFNKSAASAFVQTLGRSRADYWKSANVVASAPGLGLAWSRFDDVDGAGDVVLRLVPDFLMHGRIIDLEGRPVAGVKVVPAAVSSPILTSQVEFFNPPPGYSSVQNPLALSGMDDSIVTDADGRFRISGMGRDRRVQLDFYSNKVSIRGASTTTRPRPQGPAPQEFPVSLYGDKIELTAAPAISVAGVVRDIRTKKPLAGVMVRTSDRCIDPSITDEQGRYRLDGLAKLSAAEISAASSVDPYVPASHTLEPQTGAGPATLDFEMRRGIWITGKVTSESSGLPMAAEVDYFAMASNKAAAEIPVLRLGLAQCPLNCLTQPDGTYRLVGLPGSGIVAVRSHDARYRKGIEFDQIKDRLADGRISTLNIDFSDKTYSVAQELKLADDAVSGAADFKLDSGTTLHLACVDPQGKPIAVSMLGQRNPSMQFGFTDSSNGEVDLLALAPEDQRLIYAINKQRKLGKAFVLRSADIHGDKITLKLEPLATVTGRLINADGDPVKNQAVLVDSQVDALRANNQPNIAFEFSRDDGRYTLLLPAGCNYTIVAARDGNRSGFRIVSPNLSVTAGETKDLGDFQVGPGMAREKTAAKPATQPTSQRAAADKAMGVAAVPGADDLVHVRGRVLNPKGKPLANARVVTSPEWPAGYDQALRPAVLSVARSDAQGRFEISFSKSDASPFSLGFGQPGAELWKKMKIAAAATGMGVAWKRFDEVDGAGDVVLQLVEDLPLEGRIIDLEGRPVVGVKVIATYVGSYLQKDYVNKTPPAAQSYLSFPLVGGGLQEPVLTDDDGRFRMSGLGRERSVGLDFQSDKVVILPIRASTHEGPPVTIALGSDKAGHLTYYGNKVDITAAPAISVAGVVRDARTKLPLAGVSVRTTYSRYDARAVTDAQGRYRLDGLERQQTVEVTARSLEEPYVPSIHHLPDRRDKQQVTLDFELTRGVWITGKVTDRDTGAPVPAEIDYFAFVSNKIAAAIPLLSEGRGTAPLNAETQADGSYRVVGLPGRGVVVVRSRDDRYRMGLGFDQIKDRNRMGYINTLFPIVQETRNNAAREINITDAPATADFQLESGATLHIVCVDPDGKPIDVDVRATRVSIPPSAYGRSASGTFDMLGLASGEKRMLVVINDSRRLGKVMMIGSDDVQRGQLTVRLEPTAIVIGRLINPDGDPVKGGRLRVDTVLPAAGRANLDNVAITQNSGDDGRFTLCLPGACTYGVLASHNPYGGDFKIASKELSVTSGQSVDIGDVTVSPAMRN